MIQASKYLKNEAQRFNYEVQDISPHGGDLEFRISKKGRKKQSFIVWYEPHELEGEDEDVEQILGRKLNHALNSMEGFY